MDAMKPSPGRTCDRLSPVVLFRVSPESEGEFECARRHCAVVEQRADIASGSLVVCRYSALPFYRELCRDVELLGSGVLNAPEQHEWIAGFSYYGALRRYTPESWFEDDFHHCAAPGPFVVKGATNSRKHQWATHMYAETRRDALETASRLRGDGLIGSQRIVIRRYVPLETFEVGINGVRFANEWRFFYCGARRLAGGYYWSIARKTDWKMPPEAGAFADRVARVVSRHVNFFVLDVARAEAGGWLLVEVNDGSMSGLSMVDADELYGNLAAALRERGADGEDG